MILIKTYIIFWLPKNVFIYILKFYINSMSNLNWVYNKTTNVIIVTMTMSRYFKIMEAYISITLIGEREI